MATTQQYSVIASCKYHGRKVNIDLDTAKYRLLVDLNHALQQHGGQAMWKSIHMQVGGGIKLAGATKLQLIATLPYIKIDTTNHGTVITYKQ